MKIKCRGYTGNLIYLHADELRRVTFSGKESARICVYEICIRADDGAKINLRNVKESEIEVVHED